MEISKKSPNQKSVLTEALNTISYIINWASEYSIIFP